MALRETRLKYFVSDVDIYFHYFGEFDLTSKYNSPFRNDPRASFMFKNIGSFKNPEIIWNDFGMIDLPQRNGVGFVQTLYNINRVAAVDKIWEEMVLSSEVKLVKRKINQPLNLPYEYTKGELQDFELAYWNLMHIEKWRLDFFNVHSLVSLRRVGKKLWGSVEDNPAFIYLFEKEDAFKAYRPLDKWGDKFRGVNNGNILEGYDQLPHQGETLFVTSSLKDTIVVNKAGWWGTNPTSENSRRALYSHVRELNCRFKNIYTFFDNDVPGINAALSLQRETGWKPIMLPSKETKDPSDLVMYEGNYLYLKIFLSRKIKELC